MHCTMIQACKAGKDVYVEKPLALTVHEGRAMVKAAKETNRVVQVGIQRRSSEFAKEAADFIRGGGIGKVTVVRAFHVMNESPMGIGRPPDEDPPKGFDWDAWLGPAPKRRYNRNRTFYRFRWFYDHSGGQLTNFGVHYLAEIHWALGAIAPKAAVAMGGKFADYDNREIPDTMEVRLALSRRHAGQLFAVQRVRRTGVWQAMRDRIPRHSGHALFQYQRLRGCAGYNHDARSDRTHADRSGQGKELPHWRQAADFAAKKVAGKMLDADHARNFLDCVKSRQTPSCDIEFAHRCTTAAHIGNIAHKMRAYLEWDAKKEMFVNNADANKMLGYEYRKPHVLPT